MDVSDTSFDYVVVPEVDKTLADSTALFLADHQKILFIAVPPTPEAIAAAKEDILLQLSQIILNNKVCVVSDTDKEAPLDHEDPTLVSLRGGTIFHVLERGCRGNIEEILRVIEKERDGGFINDFVLKRVAKKFANMPT